MNHPDVARYVETHRALENFLTRLETLIDATPTGEGRNELTDMNIRAIEFQGNLLKRWGT